MTATLRRTKLLSMSTTARARSAAILTVALLGVGWLCTTTVAGDSIPASEAAQHLGEMKTVCGTVASTKYLSNANSRPTFLNLDKPYPEQVFTVVIWGDDRAHFKQEPETAFSGKRLCVAGRIEAYKGKPQIIARDPAQIVVEGK